MKRQDRNSGGKTLAGAHASKITQNETEELQGSWNTDFFLSHSQIFYLFGKSNSSQDMAT